MSYHIVKQIERYMESKYANSEIVPELIEIRDFFASESIDPNSATFARLSRTVQDLTEDSRTQTDMEPAIASVDDEAGAGGVVHDASNLETPVWELDAVQALDEDKFAQDAAIEARARQQTLSGPATIQEDDISTTTYSQSQLIELLEFFLDKDSVSDVARPHLAAALSFLTQYNLECDRPTLEKLVTTVSELTAHVEQRTDGM